MRIQDLYRLKNVRATEQVILHRIEILDRYGEANAGAKKSLADTLSNLYRQEIEEEKRLRAFIGTVEDKEIRKIMELRFLEDLPWVEVSVEVAPLEKDSSRTAPIKKIERYLKNLPEMSHISKE